MGRHPYKGITTKGTSSNPTAQEFADKMHKTREEVGSALKKAAEDMAKYYDKKRSKSVEYKSGDKVWLEGTNITMDRPMKKLDDKRFGPFKIVKKVGHSSYQLEIPKTWKKIHNVFNEVLLTPYIEPIPNQPRNNRPPPIIAEGQEPEYEVDEIIDSRKSKNGKMTYKVKWKGYGPHEWTWEPTSSLGNAKEAIKDFHKKFPNKPKPKSQLLRKLEIPISLFPKELFREMPKPLTEEIPRNLPTESMTIKFTCRGLRALERG